MPSINIIAVLISAALSMGVGYFWYGPKAFGDQWMKLVGLSKSDLEKANEEGCKAMPIAFVGALVQATALSMILSFAAAQSLGEATKIALLVGIGFFGVRNLGVVLWEHKPKELFCINTGYDLVVLTLMSWVLVSL